VNQHRGTKDAGGFSLIELLDLRREATKREMDDLANSITGDPAVISSGARADFGYVGDIGAFPPDLEALYQNPGGYATWQGPYLSPGFTEDAIGFKTDQWGEPYAYSGGITIVSTGGGATITKKIADAASDYLSNSFDGQVRDAADSIPGAIYRDSVDGQVRDAADSIPGAIYRDSVLVIVTVPNGAGGTGVTSTRPDSAGSFTLNGLPAGIHPLEIIYEPNVDTLHRYLTILPRHKTNPPPEYRFTGAYFSGAATGGCSGPGSDTLRPIGSGFETGLTTTGCSDNWQCVDEVIPDDNGSYVRSVGTSWGTDLYETADPVDTSCTITAVRVITRGRRSTNGWSAELKVALRIGGTTYEGPIESLTMTWTTYTEQWLTNPATGSAWRWDEIRDIEIGVSLNATKANQPARGTTVWLVVEYSN